MIPGRMRRHAAPSRCIIEQKNGISRTARFERADLLKIFALKKQRCAGRVVQSRADQHRRPMNVRTNPLMRGADVMKSERHNSQIYNPSSLAASDLLRTSSFESAVVACVVQSR